MEHSSQKISEHVDRLKFQIRSSFSQFMGSQLEKAIDETVEKLIADCGEEETLMFLIDFEDFKCRLVCRMFIFLLDLYRNVCMNLFL